MPDMYRAPDGTPLPPGHHDNDLCPGGRHWERGRVYPTPPAEMDHLMAAAVHELGHSLIACQSGLRTRWVSIRRSWLTGSVSGLTEISCEDVYGAEKRTVLILAVAGMEATSIWARRVHHWPAREASNYGLTGGCSDQKIFRAFARGTGYTLSRARAEARGILTAHWPRIERASGVLYRRRKVKAAQLVGKGA